MAGALQIGEVRMMTGSPSRVVSGGADVNVTPGNFARRSVRGMVGILLVVAASSLGYVVAFKRGLMQLRTEAQQRLAVEAARLDGYLSRFEYLPSLLETSPTVFRLLESPQDSPLRQSVSLYLKSVNLLAGSENLYVLSNSGDALAAADFEEPGTPLGRNLSYRPYVTEALAKGSGQFFGVGITSARAGYYLSYALRAGKEPRGIATVKVNLDSLEREWRDIDSNILALDERRVAILASRDDWRFRPVAPLSAQVSNEIAQSKPYGNSDLKPLGWTYLAELEAGTVRVTIESGETYILTERPVNRGLWRLALLDSEAPIARTALIIGALSGLVSIVALLAFSLIEQRRREVKQRLASREALQAANDMLEIRVQERTAELSAAQDDLVHAGKLAALGQMSAGIVHELNQPLAALQTASENAIVLVDRGSVDEARGNLTRIGELIRRLARLTSQLRVFAYKSNTPLMPISVEKAINETLRMLAERVRQDHVKVSTNIDSRIRVRGDQTRLEQLLGNILGNALDALESVEEKSIRIRVAKDDARAGWCRIAISNSGPAIAPDMIGRMFEPFVTTKPAGKGLGLGLMLSSHIARSFGGELRAQNLEPRGVEFVFLLPVVEATEFLHER